MDEFSLGMFCVCHGPLLFSSALPSLLGNVILYRHVEDQLGFANLGFGRIKMRFGLMIALLSCCMVLTAPIVRAEAKPSALEQLANLANGRTPSISSASNSLYVAFEKDEAIYCTGSSDKGKHWTPGLKISGACISSSHPTVGAAADGSVNIVFQAKAASKKSTGVFYVRSADAGKTFSEPVDISDTPTESSEPQLAIGNNSSLHVVWIDALPKPGGPDVFYSVSTDAGKTWSKREDVSNTPGGISSNPAINVGSDSRVHIAWVDTSSGEDKPDIFYVSKSVKSWGEVQDLSKDSGYSALPHISCGPNGKLYIVWTDNSKKVSGDILCLIEQKPGLFGKPVNISHTRGVSSQPALSVDGNDRAAALWIDTSATQKVPDIWARTGHKGQFGKEIELCHTDEVSVHPSLTIVDGTAYAVWEEIDGSTSTIKGCSLSLK